MKLKIYFGIVLVVVLGGISCKKKLDENPYSSLSSEVVFSNETGLKQAVYGIYQSYVTSDYAGNFYRFVLSESGHQYATAGIFGDAFFDPYYRFGEDAEAGALAVVWSRAYATISRANTVIDNADNAVSDTTLANQYKAEAMFLRAYTYFNLVRDFGGVPIIDHQITSLTQKDLIYASRATTQATYDFIVSDLQYAEAHLTDAWTGSDLGRVSAGIAKAMLGKVYLHMAGKPLNLTQYYALAASKLQEVVGTQNEARYGFGLVDNFSDVFSLSSEHNQEILLSFSYFVTDANLYGSIYPFFLFPRGLVNGDEQTFYGLTYPFYQLFEDGDTRRDFTVVNRYAFVGNPTDDGAVAGDSIIYDPSTRKYLIKRLGTVFGNALVNTGMGYGKMARVARPSGSGGWGYSTDEIDLRFSDVLLCLAEALTEEGQSADALPYLNRVRQRAHASLYTATGQDELRTAVRLERRLELTGEFTTVYDIRRWGTLQAEIAAMSSDQVVNGNLGTYAPKYEIYPIPQTQIDANPNLVQTDIWK